MTTTTTTTDERAKQIKAFQKCNRPAKKVGYRVGDWFDLYTSRRAAHGTITKINRVNVVFEARYMGQPMPGLTIARAELEADATIRVDLRKTKE